MLTQLVDCGRKIQGTILTLVQRFKNVENMTTTLFKQCPNKKKRLEILTLAS